MNKDRKEQRLARLHYCLARVEAKLEKGTDNHGDPIGPNKKFALQDRVIDYTESIAAIEEFGVET